MSLIAKLRLLLLLGYPPLLVYLVPLILYNYDTYRFSKITQIKANAIISMFIVPQYAVCFMYLVFHLSLCCSNKCSAILVVFFSSAFSFFAGCSLFIISQMTSQFQLNTIKQRDLFIGFVLLVCIQFLGYYAWPLIVHGDHNRTNTRWRRQSASIDSSGNCIATCCYVLQYFLWAVIISFGFYCFVSYTVNLISMGYVFHYFRKYKATSMPEGLYVFGLVTLHSPLLLYPILVASQIMIVVCKKLWLSLVVVQVKSLLDFSLGFSIFHLAFLFLSYIFKSMFPDQKDPLVATSFKSILVSCLLLLISNGLLMLPWSCIWRTHVSNSGRPRVTEISSDDLFEEETQALISSTRDP